MAAFHVMADASGEFARPEVMKITVADLMDALRSGLDDFKDKPSHYVFLCLMYPIAGFFLVMWSSNADLLPLLYPLISGFALVGPIAALGLYEISRRREQGVDSSWHHALEVRHSPALPSIIAVGLMLLAYFVAWLIVAQLIYTMTVGEGGLTSISTLLSEVLTTSRGFSLMLWGNLAGFVFAIFALATTVVTFPLLLDRDVDAVAAVNTSIRATLCNPGPVALWGLIVAALLAIGTIPIFVGLAVVMPILGHSTWHLYRKLVVPIYPNRTS
ncbi:DUF2189 domain-containing protein [Rhizobium sp. P40RR-XXII]|uniref:DUF2189 domain-containing protein n=1 Tax=unclassified Rhizobium TaxID=2613769 RepID=UPI0014571972|nr:MULTISPECIES: DUF2189 domain-containing protein [unclassified Rhizobium]NLR84663.1 DUF2189 domain-containing protein [Rhizobium sp. P28RR-XV]NLS16430.1 DUF2189 domain-containing protein [Rhizobium sp. P40RR-XXII]